jgi:hypothetical protein
MDFRWTGIVVLIIGVGLMISCLVTRRALNPLRGLEPLIVTRDHEPLRYWISVAMNLIPVGIGLIFVLIGD